MTRGATARPLRIGICASYDLGRAGGVSTHVRAQASALRRLGHDVCVFGASSKPLPAGEISLCGCVSRVIGETETSFGINPRSWWTSKKLLQESQFDVLHMHEPLMPLHSWFVLWQAQVPIIATFHTYREQGHKWYPKYRWIFDPLLKRVSVRLAVSEAAKRTVATHFPGDYEVVPNAIDVDRFCAPAARPPSMPAGHRYVLYVGRLEPRKGIDRLLRAMSIVRREVPCAQLVIVGDGPDRESLEAEARRVNVDVVFAGRVDDCALAGFYQAADVVCSPALGDESFGIVHLEAMAASRPIVATNIAGFTELLRPAGCARFAVVGDHESLATEICAVLQDAGLSRSLGEHGVKAVRRYDWTVIAKRLEQIYLETVQPADVGVITRAG